MLRAGSASLLLHNTQADIAKGHTGGGRQQHHPLHDAGHSPGASGLCNHANNHEHRVVYMYVSAIAIISSMGNHLFLLTKAKSIPEA